MKNGFVRCHHCHVPGAHWSHALQVFVCTDCMDVLLERMIAMSLTANEISERFKTGKQNIELVQQTIPDQAQKLREMVKQKGVV